MNSVHKVTSFLILLLVFLVRGSDVHAQEQSVVFNTQAIIEEHQKDKSLSYWNLKVKGGEVIHLQLKIRNGDKKNSFDISSSQAVNNSNFTIDYSLPKERAYSFLAENSISFDFYEAVLFGEKLEKGKTSLTLEAHQEILLPITLKIPDQGLQGQVIGGINVTRRAETSENQEGILNVYSNAIALVMESDKLPKEEGLEIEPGKLSLDYQSIVVQNPSPRLREAVHLKAVIKDKEGKVFAQFQAQETAVVPKAKVELALEARKALKKSEKYKLTVNSGKEELLQKVIRVTESGEVLLADEKDDILKEKALFGKGIIAILILFVAAVLGYKFKVNR